MTRYQPAPTSVRIRDIARWWPLVLVVMLIAVGGAVWSERRQVPSYSATTNVVLVPLPQWEETFLGTSLLHSAGDAARTTSTAAAMLSSSRAAILASDYLDNGWTPDEVAAAVTVSPVQDSNLVLIAAQARERDRAEKLAEGYAKAVLENRWHVIAAELDARIATINDSIAASPNNPNVAAQYQLMQTLQLARDGGSDFTMKVDSTSPAVQVDQMSFTQLVSLAAVGGLCVGLFAAAGAAMMRRRMGQAVDAAPDPVPPARVHASSEGL